MKIFVFYYSRILIVPFGGFGQCPSSACNAQYNTLMTCAMI
jgi:hypothetical protein